MDSDGFTVVKRARKLDDDDLGTDVPAGGAGASSASASSAGYSVASLATATVGSKIESDNAKRKKKRGSLLKSDFYAFQKQDTKLTSESLSIGDPREGTGMRIGGCSRS